MKIFIDIGHPAHVHYFKHLIHELKSEGHEIIIVARDKEMAHYLLRNENLEYISRGKGADGLIGKANYLVKANYQLYKIAKKETPDLFLSFASPYCAQVAWFLNKPSITLDDTETAKLGQALYRPFSSKLLTPESFKRDFGDKHTRFRSYMELSYLHPSRFEPDPEIFQELGLSKGDKYSILRFVGMSANHDVGLKGISLENKIRAAETFSQYGRVFISSETELPDELEKYRFLIKPHQMHHALAFASMLYGESGTMASEAAVLGTPSIFVNKYGLGYLSEQGEKYGLVFSFSETLKDQNASIKKGEEILKADREIWKSKKEKLLGENIDLTSYLKEYINQYLRDL